MKVNKVWGDILTTLYAETKTPLCIRVVTTPLLWKYTATTGPTCTLRFFYQHQVRPSCIIVRFYPQEASVTWNLPR